MMEHLPPVGWADLATKRDLDNLEASTKHAIDGLRHEFAGLEERMMLRVEATLHRELRAQTFRLFSAVTALAALFVAMVKI